MNLVEYCGGIEGLQIEIEMAIVEPLKALLKYTKFKGLRSDVFKTEVDMESPRQPSTDLRIPNYFRRPPEHEFRLTGHVQHVTQQISGSWFISARQRDKQVILNPDHATPLLKLTEYALKPLLRGWRFTLGDASRPVVYNFREKSYTQNTLGPDTRPTDRAISEAMRVFVPIGEAVPTRFTPLMSLMDVYARASDSRRAELRKYPHLTREEDIKVWRQFLRVFDPMICRNPDDPLPVVAPPEGMTDKLSLLKHFSQNGRVDFKRAVRLTRDTLVVRRGETIYGFPGSSSMEDNTAVEVDYAQDIL